VQYFPQHPFKCKLSDGNQTVLKLDIPLFFVLTICILTVNATKFCVY